MASDMEVTRRHDVTNADRIGPHVYASLDLGSCSFTVTSQVRWCLATKRHGNRATRHNWNARKRPRILCADEGRCTKEESVHARFHQVSRHAHEVRNEVGKKPSRTTKKRS